MRLLLLASNMVSQRSVIVTLLLLPLALVAACDKVPLLAPTGSVITLIPSAFAVSLNSELTITATVIENGVASGGSGPSGGTTTRSGAGTPVQNGTLITFTTTIGRIEPSDARTHNGQVTVKLITGGTSGSPTITAYSGGASTTNKEIKIGTAAVDRVTVTASPQSLGSSGGSAVITAIALDDGGSGIAGVPVIFSTDKGSVSPSTANTDANGVATATLTTTATAKVTASAGSTAKSDATVTVSAFGLSGFTATPSSASAGVPIQFTVTPNTNASLSNVKVDFGDGDSQSLGAISAAFSVQHVYGSPGTYSAVATAFDNSGGVSTLSTTVLIGSLQVTLAASPSSPAVGVPVQFTATLSGAPVIDHFTWTLDDGTGPFTTTSSQLSHTFTSRGLKNVRVDVFGIGSGKIGTAQLTLDVQ